MSFRRISLISGNWGAGSIQLGILRIDTLTAKPLKFLQVAVRKLRVKGSIPFKAKDELKNGSYDGSSR